MKQSVIQILPTLKLTGGTAAKVKLLAQYSCYRQIICVVDHKDNKNYIGQWNQIENCQIEPIYTFRNPLLNAIRLHRLMKKYDAKIIHAYFPIDSVSASLLKLFNPTIKIVRSFEGALTYSNWKRKIQAVAFKNHDTYIAISKYVRNFYQNMFPIIAKRGIEIVYNCPAFLDEIKSPVIHDVNDKRIVNVGCCNPTKNTAILVKAARILKDRGIHVEFDIIGDGCLRPQIEELIKELQVEDRVFLRGYQDNVKPYLDASSIYVHPANLEGFGMAVVEAMSRYCAVIVSDSCALPELVKDGVDGLIAKTYDEEDWANKIEWLLSNQAVVNDFGLKAYQKTQTVFSIGAYVKNLDDIYTSLYELQ